MPLVNPSQVVSFSSEDPNNPAGNLLNRETFRKWKCKEPGEKEAFVILKFDKAVEISCIDIGNDGSALVEVSVARSGSDGEPKFEVLLSSTAFMSPLDSREGKNLNGVKSFSVNSLCKPIASQKWDLVKVQVSQPFNRHVQYGLTFIKFVAAPDPNEPQKIGLFGLRKPIGGGDSDDDDDLRPGSLFSKKIMSPKPSSNMMSTNVAIREASSKLANASKSTTENDVKGLLRQPKLDLPVPSPSSSSVNKGSASKNSSPLLNKKQLQDVPIKKIGDKSGNLKTPKSAISSSSPKVSNGVSTKKRTLSPNSQASSTSSPSTSKSTGTPAKKLKTTRKTKPFSKLFDGVVFSMSGFENPLRGQLRDKAIAMGAKYKNDWDKTCTHLICAFYNTPKFRQVRRAGNGKIVKKNWIEKSHADRCRYPWRRHCLDRNDQGSESDEEIYAEVDENHEEFLDDTEEPETLEKVTPKGKKKRVLVMESSEDDEKSDDSKKAYDADTDVDEDRTPDLSPSIMDTCSDASPFFKDVHFCLNLNKSSLDQQDDSRLERLIIKHKGKLHKTPNDQTEYVICSTFDWNDDFSDALSDNPNLVFIHKNWIVECDKEDQMVEKNSFILSPS